jgi:hypothetical protein
MRWIVRSPTENFSFMTAFFGSGLQRQGDFAQGRL